MKLRHANIVNGAMASTLCVPRSDRASIYVRYHTQLRDTSPAGANALVLDAPNVAIAADQFSLDGYEYPNPNAAQLIFNSTVSGTIISPSSATDQVLLTTSPTVAG